MLDLGQKNVDNTVMVSVVAVKSRAFSSLPCPADELGGSTARQPARLASGEIPYRGRHAQCRDGLDGGGRNWLFSFA